MALYVGNDKIKRKVCINGIPYKLRYSPQSSTSGARLLSSDGLALCDVNGVHITAKDGE